MKILSLVAFFAFAVYLFLGIYTYRLDRRSSLNRIFSLLCLDFAVWSFAYTFFYSAPDKQTTWFWYHVSSPGWCLFPAITLHFFLILTGQKDIFKKWWIYPTLYMPGIVFMYKTLTGDLLVADFVYGSAGWCEVALSGTLWFWAYVFYYSSFILAWFLLTYRWRMRADNAKLKKQAKVILTVAFPVLLGSISTDTILPALEIYALPSVANILILLWVFGIWYAIVKYKLMDLTPAVAAEDIVSAMYDLLILADHDGKIIKLNRRTIELLGIDESEMIGRPLESLFDEQEFIRQKLSTAAQLNHDTAHCELKLRTRNDQSIPLDLSCSIVKDNSGDPVGYAIVGHDLRQMRQLHDEIAERKSAEARLQYITLFDIFTGLPSRKLFFDRMTQIIADAKNDRAMCALLLVDFRDIRDINITYGRETSGIILKETAARLEKYNRDSDMAARIGEDSFVIMMSRVQDGGEVQNVARRTCAALLKPFSVNDTEFIPDTAVGIGIYPFDGESAEALLKKAMKDKQPIKSVLFPTIPPESGPTVALQDKNGLLSAPEASE